MAGVATARSWTIRVRGLLMLPNRLMASTLRERMATKRAWRDLTRYALIERKVPYLGRASVAFLRYSSGTPDSSDALPSAFKHVRDALIGTVIADDDDAHLLARYIACKCQPGKAYIELHIEPWEGPAATEGDGK